MEDNIKPYPKYKNSIYDWLGDVPNHWEERFVRSITQLSDERNGQRQDLELLSVYREYGVIRKASRDDNHNVESLNLSNYKYVGKNYLVMNKMKMWQGSLGVSKHEGIVSPAYIVCTFKEEYKYSFIHYLLRSAKFKTQYNRISYGIRVGQWDMRYHDFKQIKLYLPKLSEQTQIANFLDYKVALIIKFIKDKKQEIKLLKEQIEYLCFSESVDKQIIRSWETAFNPSWKKIKAKRIFDEKNIKNCPDEELLAVTQDRGVVFKKNCSQNYVSPTGSLDGLKLVKDGDFVISLRSFQGGIEYSYCQGIVSPAYNVFSLKPQYDSEELKTYFRFLFKTKPFIELLKSLGGGIRDGKNISFSEFAQFEMAIPSDEQLKTILKLSKVLDTLQANSTKLFAAMNDYKISLISDVVTGKVDVRNVVVEKMEDIPEEEIEETEDLESSEE